jgi:hypothetical protein
MCKGTITQKICLMHASNRIESQPETYRKTCLFRVFKTRFRWGTICSKRSPLGWTTGAVDWEGATSVGAFRVLPLRALLC